MVRLLWSYVGSRILGSCWASRPIRWPGVMCRSPVSWRHDADGASMAMAFRASRVQSLVVTCRSEVSWRHEADGAGAWASARSERLAALVAVASTDSGESGGQTLRVRVGHARMQDLRASHTAEDGTAAKQGRIAGQAMRP